MNTSIQFKLINYNYNVYVRLNYFLILWPSYLFLDTLNIEVDYNMIP